MKNSLISIVVPVYNVASYLSQCLDSLVNQTYLNIEIITVDDGSTDGCSRILQEYALRDSRIRLISQSNQGLSEARNVGLNYVRGEYICFVDSDDWLELNTLSKAYEKAQLTQSDVVLWNYVKEYGVKSVPVYCIDKNRFYDVNQIHSLFQRIVGPVDAQLRNPQFVDSLSTAWGKLYKSDVIIKNQLRFVSTKEIGTEDLLFTVQAFKYIRKAYLLSNQFNHYRKNNGTSLTVSYKPDLLKKWTTLQDRLYEQIKDDPYLLIAFNNRIALSIIGLGLNECMSGESFQQIKGRLVVILDQPRYRMAYKDLKLKYFPIHWKVFFLCAKYRAYGLLLVLLNCIKLLVNK